MMRHALTSGLLTALVLAVAALVLPGRSPEAQSAPNDGAGRAWTVEVETSFEPGAFATGERVLTTGPYAAAGDGPRFVERVTVRGWVGDRVAQAAGTASSAARRLVRSARGASSSPVVRSARPFVAQRRTAS